MISMILNSIKDDNAHMFDVHFYFSWNRSYDDAMKFYLSTCNC